MVGLIKLFIFLIVIFLNYILIVGSLKVYY